jgi:predicted P-loop ATPase
MLKEMERLHAQGFAIHWLHPKSKRPIGTKWTEGPRKTLEELRAQYRPGMNMGVRLGEASVVSGKYLAVIDCDVKDPAYLQTMNDALKKVIKGYGPVVMSGRGNGSMHIYALTSTPTKTKVLVREKDKWEIQLLGQGAQVVLPPSIHPDTGKEYKWRTEWVHQGLAMPCIDFISCLKESETGQSASIQDFTAEEVDLLFSDLDEGAYQQLVNGKGVEDRSAAILGVAIAMFKAGFTKNQMRSELTNPANFLGQVAFDHTKNPSRKRAVQWVDKYVLRRAEELATSSVEFEREVITETLDDTEAEAQAREVIPETQELVRAQVNGPPRSTVNNIMIAIKSVLGSRVFKFDEFANSDSYAIDTPWGGKADAHITDLDFKLIGSWLDRHFRFEPAEQKVVAAVCIMANQNKYHPIRDYLDELHWDGEPRLDTWLEDIFEAEGPTEYLRAVSRKTLCAAVKRIYEPGCKADSILVLENPNQGIGKSWAARILAGDAFFSDSYLDVRNKDAALGLRSKWIIEMGELAALQKGDLETMKAFITTQADYIRAPYGRKHELVPRQCIFIGTTNGEEYLKDESGNRRFWPVRVNQCNFKKLEKNRDQLFAEAKFALDLGEKLYLERGTPEWDQALEMQDDRLIKDILSESVQNLLDHPELNLKNEFTMSDFMDQARLSSCKGIEDLRSLKMDKTGQNRLGSAFRSLNFTKRKRRVGKKTFRFWSQNVD